MKHLALLTNSRCVHKRAQVHAPRDRNKLDYKGLVFYWDTIHPDGITGHR